MIPQANPGGNSASTPLIPYIILLILLLLEGTLIDRRKQFSELVQSFGWLCDVDDPSKFLALLVVLGKVRGTWKILSFEQLWQMHLSIFSTYYMKP